MKTISKTVVKVSVLLSLTLMAAASRAQINIDPFSQQYKDAAMAAWPVVEPFARSLFWTLAAIQLAWAAIMLALEKSDLQGWVVGIIRQIFFIGLGAAILVNAKTWMWAIFNSFTRLGAAVNPSALEPGDIFGRGVEMAGSLLSQISALSPGVAIAIAIAAAVVVLAFTILAVTLLLALIEGAIAVVLGQILLGFAGSKWTIGYLEKYLGMIVNVGLKVFVTYFMAGVAMIITQNWVAIAASTTTADRIYELMGGSIVLAIVVWSVPRFISMVIGGSPSLGFSDAAGVVAGMATAVGTVAGGAIAGGMKVGSATSGALRGNSMTGTTSSGGGYSGSDGATVMPPTTPGGGGSGGGYGGPSPGYGGGAARTTYGAGGAGSSAFSGTADRPTQSAEQNPPSRENSGDGADSVGSRGDGMGSRISGQNDLISSAAQGVAAQAGMSRFVPSSVGSASTRGTGTAAPDSGSPAGGVMPPVIPGGGMAGGAAVSPPMGNPTIGGEALGSRGGVDVAGNAPQGVGGTSMDLGGGSPAGITTSAPMTTGGASGTPGLTPGTSGGGLASPAPMQGTGEQTGMSAAATMVSAGAIIGSGGSSPPTSPPPPPPAPEQRQESLPGIKDDYERMDQANRRNKLTLDRPRHPDQPGLRGPSRPKP